MPNLPRSAQYPLSLRSGLGVFLTLLLLVGIAFHWINLERKVYWHDEVYTSLRAAGYTGQEIGQQIFQNRILPASELLQFQQIKPGSTIADTIHSLVVEDPQHPPLYFLMARGWMQLFGPSVVASRSLPVLTSLLALPCMYLLAWELFASRLAALLATTFLALSPFDLLFAQTARQYSLLTLSVILSSYCLLRALKASRWIEKTDDGAERSPDGRSLIWQPWALYTLSVALGLYTHPFFALTIAAQGVFVLLEVALDRAQPIKPGRLMITFGLAVAGAIVLYAPWVYVLVTGFGRATSVTSWTGGSPGLDHLLKLWLLSFTALFLDLDFGFTNPLTFLLRLPIAVLLGIALYALCRRYPFWVWCFVFTSILVPFLLLATPDVLMGGQRSAVSRYLISSYPGVQLAIAALFALNLSPSPPLPIPPSPPLRPLWYTLLILLSAAAIASCTVSAHADTWWHKVPSYFNPEAARRINAIPGAIVFSDRGNDYTNLGDLISLGYLLHRDVPLLLVDADGADAGIQNAIVLAQPFATKLSLRPSARLQQALEQRYGTAKPLLVETLLWRFGERG
jgi:uncharacterized membrane protein